MYVYTKIFTQRLTVVLFLISKNCKLSSCPLVNEELNSCTSINGILFKDKVKRDIKPRKDMTEPCIHIAKGQKSVWEEPQTNEFHSEKLRFQRWWRLSVGLEIWWRVKQVKYRNVQNVEILPCNTLMVNIWYYSLVKVNGILQPKSET